MTAGLSHGLSPISEWLYIPGHRFVLPQTLFYMYYWFFELPENKSFQIAIVITRLLLNIDRSCHLQNVYVQMKNNIPSGKWSDSTL